MTIKHDNRRQRGVAMLLVMITLVVCTILTAGFLSSQGTSIGIARNERDAEKARGMAQSGLELCEWLMRNRSDWRTAMSPGTWLNSYAVGEGSVTVTAANQNGAASFASDVTQPVVFTSTGTYNGRTFTLTATIGPTGGGTVFRGGCYSVGKIILGNDNSSGSALVDSYNSSVGSYAITMGSNALFQTGYTDQKGLQVFASSDYLGAFVTAPGADLSNTAYATFAFNLPSSISKASLSFVPGTVILPNMVDLVYRGNMNHSGGSFTHTPGTYDSMNLSPTLVIWSVVNLSTTGIYHVTGNVSLTSLAAISVPDGINATLVIDGNLTATGSSQIRLTGSGTLNIFVKGSVTFGNSTNMNTGGKPANLTIFATSSGNINFSNGAYMFGSIYAVNANVQFQNSSQIYGAAICKSLTLKDSSALHFDEDLKNKRIDNLTGGSAPPGTADYSMSIVGATTVN